MTGYLTHLKTALVMGLRQTFNSSTYPEVDFRNIHVSIEYPVEKAAYPSIWVDYEDGGKLQIAGIRHVEVIMTNNTVRHVTRWRFSGYAQFTVVALSSLERDRLYDELVRILAFGAGGLDAPEVSIFRQYVESNQYIAMNMDFDEIESAGNAASPGTPWGTDEIIYERTINMELIGEFVSDGQTNTIVPLSEIKIFSQIQNPDGSYVDQYPAAAGHPDGTDYDPMAWH